MWGEWSGGEECYADAGSEPFGYDMSFYVVHPSCVAACGTRMGFP